MQRGGSRLTLNMNHLPLLELDLIIVRGPLQGETMRYVLGDIKSHSRRLVQ